MTDRPTTHLPDRGFKFWHLVLAVVGVAFVLRLGLGALPGPDARAHDVGDTAPAEPVPTPAIAEAAPDDEPVVAVLPFDLHGEVPGPLGGGGVGVDIVALPFRTAADGSYHRNHTPSYQIEERGRVDALHLAHVPEVHRPLLGMG